jgi:hypothetical protein
LLPELMSRMGHSSTRAARIYLHAREERDKQLAATLDKMARRELRRSRSTKAERPSENRSDARSTRPQEGVLTINSPPAAYPAGPGIFVVERVTRIELALSAWESDRIASPERLTWRFDCPLLTVIDPWSPVLMARQWPSDRSIRLGGRCPPAAGPAPLPATLA